MKTPCKSACSCTHETCRKRKARGTDAAPAKEGEQCSCSAATAASVSRIGRKNTSAVRPPRPSRGREIFHRRKIGGNGKALKAWAAAEIDLIRILLSVG